MSRQGLQADTEQARSMRPGLFRLTREPKLFDDSSRFGDAAAEAIVVKRIQECVECVECVVRSEC